MTKINSRAKSGKLRGTKVLLAALSVAATMTGWAWLTTQETALGANNTGSIKAADTFVFDSRVPRTANSRSGFVVGVGTENGVPNLAGLPVRGVRTVADGATATSNLPNAPIMNDQSNGGQQSSQVQPNTQPQPPVQQLTVRRKTRSSR